MEAMRLFNGKFYDDDNNEVPPKIGDKAQIQLLKEAQQRLEIGYVKADLESEELITYHPIVEFSCPVCERFNRHEDTWNTSEYMFDYQDIDGEEYKCYGCGSKFTAKYEDNELRLYHDKGHN